MPTQEDINEARALLESGNLSADQQQRLQAALQTATQTESRPEPLPGSLEELTGGFVGRPAFEMAGGLIGGALGATGGVAGGPAAPATIPAGAIAGGALGAAGGSLAFDTIEDALRFVGAIAPREQGILDPTKRAISAATEDAAFAGGAMLLGQGFRAIKPGIGKILGVRNEEAAEIVKAATESGIPVGAVDVGTGAGGRVTRGAAGVLGIFPFIGGPFRKAAVGKAEKVVEAVNGTLNRLAPNATLSDELGIDMAEAAKESVKEFRTTSTRLYERFRELARNAPQKDIVPTDIVQQAAQEFVETRSEGIVTLSDGSILEGPFADELGQFIEGLTKLPENISVAQYEKIIDDLQTFVKSAATEGFDIKRFAIIKESMEEALSNIRTDVEGGAEIKAAYDAATRFYSQNITRFTNKTAKKFAQVDRNVFGPGPVRPGSLNEDELALTIPSLLKSPAAIRDLRSLVGNENLGKAARKHIENIWDSARIVDEEDIITGFDWAKFSKDLGLVGKKGEQLAATEELLKSTGVSMDEIKSLVKVAARIKVPKSVNQFIARRAALGGLGSAIGGATAATVVADSLLASVGVAFLMRHGAKIVSDPKQLKLLQRAILPDSTASMRRAALGRLAEGLTDQ